MSRNQSDLAFKLHRAAEHVMLLLRGLHPEILEEKGFLGGYLYVASRDKPTLPLLAVALGDDSERFPEYYVYACEKANRTTLSEDLSSWKSRDFDKEQYGGAISTHSVSCGQNMVISFSGMPELVDEALCLGIAVSTRLIPLTMAQEIADISDNNLFRELAKLL